MRTEQDEIYKVFMSRLLARFGHQIPLVPGTDITFRRDSENCIHRYAYAVRAPWASFDQKIFGDSLEEAKVKATEIADWLADDYGQA